MIKLINVVLIVVLKHSMRPRGGILTNVKCCGVVIGSIWVYHYLLKGYIHHEM